MIYWWSGFWPIYCLFGFWSICCHRWRSFRSFSESFEIHFSYRLFFSERLRLPILSLTIYIFLFALPLITIFLIVDNIYFLFMAIILFVFSLLLLLLLKQKGGRFKSYQLSFLFSIMLHYEILMDHVLVPNFWRNFSVGISIPLYYRPNSIILFWHLLLWCINHNLFVHHNLPCTRRKLLSFLELLGLDSCSSPLCPLYVWFACQMVRVYAPEWLF